MNRKFTPKSYSQNHTSCKFILYLQKLKIEYLVDTLHIYKKDKLSRFKKQNSC